MKRLCNKYTLTLSLNVYVLIGTELLTFFTSRDAWLRKEEPPVVPGINFIPSCYRASSLGGRIAIYLIVVV